MTKRFKFCLAAIGTLHADDLDAVTAKIEAYRVAGMDDAASQRAAVADAIAQSQGDFTDMGKLLREQHPDLFAAANDPAPAPAPKPAPKAPGPMREPAAAPQLERTPAAERAEAELDDWEFTNEPPTPAEIEAAGRSARAGMRIQTRYGFAARQTVRNVLTGKDGDRGEYEADPDQPFTVLELGLDDHPRQPGSSHGVFERNGKLYEVSTGALSLDDGRGHARLYVLEGQLPRLDLPVDAEPAASTAAERARAARTPDENERVELRKQLSVLNSLLECVNG